MKYCSRYRAYKVKLTENWLLVTYITNLGRLHEKLSYRAHKGKLLTLNAKNRNKSAIWIFFQPLLKLSENWSLVTCLANLGRIHEKLFKLSRPQVNANAEDAELQLQ